MGQQLREGVIKWTQDLNGSTAPGVFPTSATAGVATSSLGGGRGGRVMIMARVQSTSTVVNSVSCDVHVYGHAIDTNGVGTWGWIKSLNSGAAITNSTVKGPDGSTVVIIESLTYTTGAPVYAENYDYIATRVVTSVNNTVVSTWIGVAQE